MARSLFARLPMSLVVGAVLLILFLGMGLLSLVWTPYDPEAIDVSQRLAPPGSGGHLLGTDRLGGDELSLLMAGARNSLLVSVVSTVAAIVPGVLLGLLVAGSGRFWQSLLSRLTDVSIALPGILIAMVLATAIGAGNTAAIVAIVVWFIPVVMRVIIGPAKQILALDYVEAALAYGRGRWYVLLRHVLPNVGPLIIVLASVLFAVAILIEAGLSYLGVGAQYPTPSWGRMLNEAQQFIGAAPTLSVFPGLAIMTGVLGFTLLGDGLREVLDPQQQTRTVAL